MQILHHQLDRDLCKKYIWFTFFSGF